MACRKRLPYRNQVAGQLVSARSFGTRSAKVAPLNEDRVAPLSSPGAVGHEGDAFAVTHTAEACPVVQSEAGAVLRKDARLHCPDTGAVGSSEEGVEECGAGALPASLVRDIDRVLDHAPIDLTR